MRPYLSGLAATRLVLGAAQMLAAGPVPAKRQPGDPIRASTAARAFSVADGGEGLRKVGLAPSTR